MTQIDPRALRNAFGEFLTGVTVVTAVREDGTPVGFTANSFSSVSLDPPLVLWSIALTAPSLAAFRSHNAFAINNRNRTHHPFPVCVVVTIDIIRRVPIGPLAAIMGGTIDG